jgi:thymidylate synthase
LHKPNQTMTYKKFTFSNRELLGLYEGLKDLKELTGSKMAFFAAKNIKEIEKVLSPIDQMATPSEEFYNVSVEAQKFIENSDDEGLKKFEEEHADIVEQRKQQLLQVDMELNKESEVYLVTIRNDQITDSVTVEQLGKILDLIEYNENAN